MDARVASACLNLDPARPPAWCGCRVGRKQRPARRHLGSSQVALVGHGLKGVECTAGHPLPTCASAWLPHLPKGRWVCAVPARLGVDGRPSASHAWVGRGRVAADPALPWESAGSSRPGPAGGPGNEYSDGIEAPPTPCYRGWQCWSSPNVILVERGRGSMSSVCLAGPSACGEGQGGLRDGAAAHSAAPSPLPHLLPPPRLPRRGRGPSAVAWVTAGTAATLAP